MEVNNMKQIEKCLKCMYYNFFIKVVAKITDDSSDKDKIIHIRKLMCDMKDVE